MMKRKCRCEHWQTCPVCYPQGFDANGKRLPIKSNPLTDEQIIQLAQEWPAETNDWASHIDFARAIEQAHGIGEKPDAA